MVVRDRIDGVFTDAKAERALFHIIDDIEHYVKVDEPISHYTITNYDGVNVNVANKDDLTF